MLAVVVCVLNTFIQGVNFIIMCITLPPIIQEKPCLITIIETSHCYVIVVRTDPVVASLITNERHHSGFHEIGFILAPFHPNS